jgi:ribosomal protein L31E
MKKVQGTKKAKQSYQYIKIMLGRKMAVDQSNITKRQLRQKDFP